MRSWKWLLVAVLACVAPLHAQPPSDAARAALDNHLTQWARKMKAVKSLSGPCVRVEVDKSFQTTQVFEGTVKFLKPSMAIIDLKNRKRPEWIDKTIWTESYTYEYSAENKTIRVHESSWDWLFGNPAHAFFSLLFGVNAEEAIQRYDWKLSKDEPDYVYLDIVPKLSEDKANFARAQLVLTKGTYFTRRLWLEQPNGNEVIWEFPKTEANVSVDRAMFNEPNPPPGWTISRLPPKPSTPPAPKTYRP